MERGDRLFLKAFVIMIVRHLRTAHELLAVLNQPTAEMETLRSLLCSGPGFPSRRTWERCLKRLPESLPAQIGCSGHHRSKKIRNGEPPSGSVPSGWAQPEKARVRCQ